MSGELARVFAPVTDVTDVTSALLPQDGPPVTEIYFGRGAPWLELRALAGFDALIGELVQAKARHGEALEEWLITHPPLPQRQPAAQLPPAIEVPSDWPFPHAPAGSDREPGHPYPDSVPAHTGDGTPGPQADTLESTPDNPRAAGAASARGALPPAGPGVCCPRCERLDGGPCAGCYCHETSPGPVLAPAGKHDPGSGDQARSLTPSGSEAPVGDAGAGGGAALERAPAAAPPPTDDDWCPGCGFANTSTGPCETCGYDRETGKVDEDFLREQRNDREEAAFWREQSPGAEADDDEEYLGVLAETEHVPAHVEPLEPLSEEGDSDA